MMYLLALNIPGDVGNSSNSERWGLAPLHARTKHGAPE